MASIEQIKFKKIYIEITNRCNLSCEFCQPLNRKYQDLSIDQFEYILQQVLPYGRFVYLHVKGEPLIHPDFDQILNLCDQYHVYVQLTTNTTLLKNLNRNHPSLRKISLSLTAIDQFQCDIEQYTKQLFTFIDQDHPYPKYIELRFWNIDQLQNNGQYLLQQINNHYDIQMNHNKHTFTLAKNRFLGIQEQFKWPDMNGFVTTNAGYCKGGIDMIAILSNGDVTLCCLDGNGLLTCGNIFEQSLDNILNSKRFIEITNGFKQTQIVDEFCQKCTYRYRFNK